ncbi:MAG: hypothetical protein WBM90_11220 [Acidimicrobiia bacterium]
MGQRDHELPSLHLGRWLLWGLLALIALTAVVVWFANVGREIEATETTIPAVIPGNDGEQVTWSIVASEFTDTPGEITLKGDVPVGFPTETWRDGEMLARSVGETFKWDMSRNPEVPEAVAAVDDAADCAALAVLLKQYEDEVGEVAGEPLFVAWSAFAQYAFDAMMDQGCVTGGDS